MNETIQIFLNILKERNHVLQLLDHTGFEIQFSCGFQKQRIFLTNREACLSIKHQEDVPTYEIKGEPEAIERLLEGKETLRSMIRWNLLSVSAPFRIILLLESLFYLMKNDDSLRKII